MNSRLTAYSVFAFTALAACSRVASVATGGSGAAAEATTCAETGGLKLPPGFCATIFADSVGAVRHMVVSSGGDLLANLQNPGRNSVVASTKSGQVALRDNDRNGTADVLQRFGSSGNTGIALYRDYLYADVGRAIVRYRIDWGTLRPTGSVDTVVTGIPGPPGHTARNFVIAGDGTMYLNIGSPSNACQEKDRSAGSKGKNPCAELQTRAGIWKFSADKLNQRPSLANRYATGLRNSIALRIAPGGQLYSVVQGRDQLFGNWSTMFTEQQNAEKPSEEFVAINQGDDFGWPYCFHDPAKGQLLLAPEYGGDGQTVGLCGAKKGPLAGMPAHWSAIDMLFYTGSQFPARYRDGAFVTFHGSWNRAPLPQSGYNVVFVPFVNGVPTDKFEVFADNFTTIRDPAKAEHRPAGIAQAPDGSLYVSDDAGGRIWKITYAGTR